MATTTQDPTLSLLLLLNRVALGLYFALAGVGKFIDPGWSQWVAGPFRQMTPAWLPSAVATPYGHALPPAEVLLGALLVVGLLARTSAWLITAMLVSFTIALVGARGLSGGGPVYIHSNFILIALAILLAVMGPGRFSVDASRARGGKAA